MLLINFSELGLLILSIQDIDECESGAHRCQADATCINTVGGYNCTCNPGYGGDGFNCTDVNECLTNDHDCHADADCLNKIGSYNCTCRSGYSGNGTICTGILSIHLKKKQDVT